MAAGAGDTGGGFGLFGLLLFSLLLPVAQAEVCPAIGHPKDFTVLLADPYDTQPANGRTPLILVHGIDGNKFPGGADNIGSPYWDYWLNFRMFFNFWGTSGSSLLKDNFKLYAFFYESNKICVNDIAKGLRDWIDQRTNLQAGDINKLEDVSFVIVAHSMGGLVSRAFMNNTVFNIGNFSGQTGGNRVIRLITLGTPHHGSIASNGTTHNGCLFEESDIRIQSVFGRPGLINGGI